MGLPTGLVTWPDTVTVGVVGIGGLEAAALGLTGATAFPPHAAASIGAGTSAVSRSPLASVARRTGDRILPGAQRYQPFAEAAWGPGYHGRKKRETRRSPGLLSNCAPCSDRRQPRYGLAMCHTIPRPSPSLSPEALSIAK
jgi:hypothetical protein